MHHAWYDLQNAKSILANFAYSDWDPKHLGRKSEGHTVLIENEPLRKVALASGNAVPWLLASEPLSDGQRSKPMVSLPFYWNLLNNTETYRVYEQFVQDGMPPNVAHLHTGDDYFAWVPIVPGDHITTTCELKVLYEKEGRAGPMKFIEDVWDFRNQRNELAGRLVRKAVTVYYKKDRTPADHAVAPDVAKLVPENRISHLPLHAWKSPCQVDVFDGRPRGYVQDIGPVSWTMMVQWMGAVDDYARTHYDYDYAIERNFPDLTPIVSGPHMGALMIAPVLALAGSGAWIEEFRHVQRHNVNPKDKLTTFGVSEPVSGDKDRVKVSAWLKDDMGRVRNTGTFILRRWVDAPTGALSRRWR